MSYQSPIDIIFGETQTKLEGDVLKVIKNYNITVDKDELLKALAYDRDQYRKGWEDGWVHAKWDIIRCKDCKHCLIHDKILFCGYWGSIGEWRYRTETDYCSRGERKNEVKE